MTNSTVSGTVSHLRAAYTALVSALESRAGVKTLNKAQIVLSVLSPFMDWTKAL
jgi:hypothetical protein